ncbi:MAG TPA: hypothetical protein VGG74_20940 [Kofleriaceae bacterium]
MRALAIVIALAGVARADSTVSSPASPATISVPHGWSKSAAPASQVAHFGGASSTVDVARYAPAGSGATLVVTRVSALPPADVPSALRSEVDAFEGAAQRASLAGSAASVQGKTEQVDAAQKLVTATLAYTDGDLATSSRLVIARSATQLVAVTGDCISRAGAGALVADCDRALATLDPGIALGDRLAPSLGTEPAPPPPSQYPQTTMSALDHAPLPPMTVPPAAPASHDRTSLFAGAGIALLAGLFWLNARRRAQLANEEDQDDR